MDRFDITEEEARLQLALGALHKFILITHAPTFDRRDVKRRKSYIVLAKDSSTAIQMLSDRVFPKEYPAPIFNCYDYFGATKPLKGETHCVLADVDFA